MPFYGCLDTDSTLRKICCKCELIALMAVSDFAAFRALQQQEGTKLDERSILCMLLVLERCRGAASQWAPFISVLPEQYGACQKPIMHL